MYMVVFPRLKDTVSHCLEQGEPLHLPGVVNFAANHLWSWEDDLRRVSDLVGDEYVQVCSFCVVGFILLAKKVQPVCHYCLCPAG